MPLSLAELNEYEKWASVPTGKLSLEELDAYEKDAKGLVPPVEDVGPTGFAESAGRGLVHGTLGLGESVGLGTQWLGKRIGSETVSDVGKTTADYWGKKAKIYEPPKEFAGKNIWDNPEIMANASWWAYNVADMVPALAASMIPAAGAGKAISVAGKALSWTPKVAERLIKLGQLTAGGAAGGGLEAAQTYKTVLEKGGTEEEAARSAEAMALGAGALNAMSIGKILNKAGTGFKAKVVKHIGAAGWEGLTEGLEEPTEVFSKYVGKYLSGEPLPESIKGDLIESLKDAITVAPIAAVTGFGGSVLGSEGQQQQAPPPPPPPPLSGVLGAPAQPVQPAPTPPAGPEQFRPLGRPDTAEQAADVFRRGPILAPAAESALTFEEAGDSIQRAARQRQEAINQIYEVEAQVEARKQDFRNRIELASTLGLGGINASPIREDQGFVLPEENIPLEEAASGPGLTGGPPQEVLQPGPGEGGQDLYQPVQGPLGGGEAVTPGLIPPETPTEPVEAIERPGPSVITPDHINALRALGYDLDDIFLMQPRDADYIIENRTPDGWDEYKVTKTKEGVTLEDGRTLKLDPWDTVEVYKKDLPKEVEKKAEKREAGPKPVRFEAGKKLTKEERQEVLRSIGDAYKDNDAPRELKYIDERTGEEVYGYAYSPDSMYESDITGRKIRHYVYLPDGKKAHPSELFPEITQAAIDRAILEAKGEAEQAKLTKKHSKEIVGKNKAATVEEANRIFRDRNKGAIDGIGPRIDASILLEKGENEFIRVQSPSVLQAAIDDGFAVRTRNKDTSWADEILGEIKKVEPEKKFINETPGAIEVKTPATLSLRQESFGKQPVPKGEGVTKKNQQTLGLVVEDRQQPGLFGKKLVSEGKKLRKTQTIRIDEDVRGAADKRYKVDKHVVEYRDEDNNEYRKSFVVDRGETPNIPESGTHEELNAIAEQHTGKKPATTPKAEPHGSTKLSVATSKKLLSLPPERQTLPFGPDLRAFRKQIMEELTGQKVPISKAGAGAVRVALAEAAGVDINKIAGIEAEKKIIDWLESISEKETTLDKKGEYVVSEDYAGYQLKDPSEVTQPKFRRPQQRTFDFKPEGIPVPNTIPPEQRTRMVTTGNIKAAGNVVRNLDDAASLLAHIRKSAQELAYTIATDKDGIVLEIHKYSKGTITSASVSPVETAGRALNIPNAKNVYFVHHHPSGDAAASPQDRNIASSIKKILALKGVSFESFIIGGTSYKQFSGETEEGELVKIKPQLRTKRLPEKERMVVKGKNYSELPSVANSIVFKEYIKNKYDNADGFLFLDSKLKPITFMKYPKGEPTNNVVAEIFKTAEKANIVGLAMYFKDNIYSNQERFEFLRTLTQGLANKLQVFEIVSNGISAADTGQLSRFAPRMMTTTEADNALSNLNVSKPIFSRRSEMPVDEKTISDFASDVKKDLGLERFDVYSRPDGSIELSLLVVKKDDRKTGIGTKAVERLTQFADKHGLRIFVNPAQKDDAFGTTSRGRLIRFYQRFGFVRNRGRNKDFRLPPGMYRNPQGTAFSKRSFKPVDVESPEFKRWFGKSKAVDENGKPRRVYHGTKFSFDEFNIDYAGWQTDTGYYGAGVYFSSAPEVANQYAGNGNVFPVYLSLKNPFVFDYRTLESAERTKTDAKKLDVKLNMYGGVIDSDAFTKKAKVAGYDGTITYENEDGPVEYVAFSPTQIKSAISNTGAFSETDPRIQFSRSIQSLTPHEKNVLIGQVKLRQHISSPTDQDLADFLDDAITDNSIRSPLTDRIFDKIGGDQNALYRAKRRDADQREKRGDARQRLRGGLKEWDYRNTDSIFVKGLGFTKEEKAVQKVIEALGYDPYFFKTPDPKIDLINGVVFSDRPENIYINSASPNPLIQVAGHEFIHSLKRTHPDLYNFLSDCLKRNVVDFNTYFDELKRDNPDIKFTAERGAEELYGDFVGDQWTKPEFWEKLSQENPSLTRRLADFINSILEKIKRAIKRYVPASEKYFKDINYAQDVIAKVMSEAANRAERAYEGTGMGDVSLAGEPAFQVSAWHGSPHKFDKFSMDKIGTGEGAQAFGHGLYFTDLEEVGRHYAKGLTTPETLIDGKPVKDYLTEEEKAENFFSGNVKHLINVYSDKGARDKDAVIFDLNEALNNPDMTIEGSRFGREIKAAIRILDKAKNLSMSKPRNLYKVTLHKGKQPGEYTWLDWDKPLSEQSDKTQTIIKQLIKKSGANPEIDRKGKELYHSDGPLAKLIGPYRTDKDMSLMLLMEGIDGIRYPAGSLSGAASFSQDKRRKLASQVYQEDSSLKNLIDTIVSADFSFEYIESRLIDRFGKERAGSMITAAGARPNFNYVVFDENAVTIDERVAFSRRAKSDLSTDTLSVTERLSSYFKKAKRVIGTKKDLSYWGDLIASVPAFFKDKGIPAVKSIVDSTSERVDEKKENEFWMENNEVKGSPGVVNVVKAMSELSKEDFKKFQDYLVKTDQTQMGFRIRYDDDLKMWVVKDRTGHGNVYTVKDKKGDAAEAEAIEKMLEFEAKDLEKQGYNPQQVQAIIGVRMTLNKGFELLFKPMRELIRAAEEQGFKLPDIPVYRDVKRVNISLKQAMAEMGDIRGSYFPRIRKGGRYVMTAKKEGSNPILETFDSRFLNKPRVAELEKQGYTVTIGRSGKVGEDVFELAGNLVKTQQIVNAALERIEKESKNELSKKHIEGISKDIQDLFASALAEQVSNVIRERGARAHMTSRAGEVYLGYEQNPLIAIPKYIKGLAGAEAKKNMVAKMLRALTGTEMSWTDYKAENPEADYSDYADHVKEMMIEQPKQPWAFKWAMAYIGENTRNPDFADNVVGVLRGAAVGKYLAFRVFSAPLVNLTALPTSTIATMKGAGISYGRAWKELGRGIQLYGKYLWNKEGMTEKDRWIFDYISKKGWDNAQYSSESLSALRSTVGRGWDKIIDWGMFTFSQSEKLNRAATIAGTFNGLSRLPENKGKSKEDIAEMAKQVSDNSHGVYNKGNYPYIALGGNPAAHIARMMYVFQRFSHTYLLNMKRLGFDEKDYVALAHMVVAPAVLAGAGASVLAPVIGAILKAFGIDDPEEKVYGQIGEIFGDTGETASRYGLAGLAGFSIKGSLALGVGAIPTSVKDVLGAPGSVISDIFIDGIPMAAKGDVAKGFEKMLPTGFGNMIRAYRESTEGLTTGSNRPVFYGNEQVKTRSFETILRAVSLYPQRIATIREKQYKEYQTESKYQEKRTDIYARIKKFYLSDDRDPETWLDILAEIEVYNEKIRNLKTYVSPITPKSIKTNLKTSFKPSRKERGRMTR